nr:5185_t:CDS:2 [Entrophospora candida]
MHPTNRSLTTFTNGLAIEFYQKSADDDVNNESLMASSGEDKLLKEWDNDQYEKIDKIPDLYPIGQLQKEEENEEVENDEESQNNDNAVNKSLISKTQEKKAKRNVEKKIIKLK